MGNGWHNYWGAMDETRIYRKALTKEEVRGEFEARKEIFNVTESAEALAAIKKDRMMGAFTAANEAWAAGDFAAVRAQCAQTVSSPEAPAHFRSYAHLRVAQSHVAQGNRPAAIAGIRLDGYLFFSFSGLGRPPSLILKLCMH